MKTRISAGHARSKTPACFYTDISLLTANETITAAVQRVFHYLTADAEREDLRPLLVAPITLAQDLLYLIEREAEHARAGRPARIIAKMNALLDGQTVKALYAASRAGVEIDLIIRGMCALRPGVRGLSERIRVRSIVGRFLEHSRIFWFENGATAENDSTEVFCGSADWMPRNLYERCEAVFPVTQPDLKNRLRDEILGTFDADTAKTGLLQDNGDYIRMPLDAHPVEAQVRLMELATCGSPATEPKPPKTPKATPRKRTPSKPSLPTSSSTSKDAS